MAELKRKLEMTVKQQGVMAMIVELLKEMPSNRIRGIHAHLDAKTENKPSHSLISATIETLVRKQVLELIELKKVPGERMKSALYEWHQDVLDICEIVTIKQKKRVSKVVGPKAEPAPAAIEPSETPEEYYTALCRDIVDLERELAAITAKLGQKREEKMFVDDSIANVQRFFREGGAK